MKNKCRYISIQFEGYNGKLAWQLLCRWRTKARYASSYVLVFGLEAYLASTSTWAEGTCLLLVWLLMWHLSVSPCYQTFQVHTLVCLNMMCIGLQYAFPQFLYWTVKNITWCQWWNLWPLQCPPAGWIAPVVVVGDALEGPGWGKLPGSCGPPSGWRKSCTLPRSHGPPGADEGPGP